MKKKEVILLIIVAVVSGVVGVSLFAGDDLTDDSAVSSFEECAELYSVMESYPRQCRTPDGKTFVEDIGNEMEKSDLIRLESPRPNAEIESPLRIRGEARGHWFFEATFSLKLLDGNGDVVAEHFAEAEEEWMTEEFVPFRATLEFELPETSSGKLILEKANPSGLPENADQLEVPVSFAEGDVADSQDCVPAGCSGELCVEESQADEVFSTCEYKPEYECFPHSTCERQDNGECGWTETSEFKQCLDNLK